MKFWTIQTKSVIEIIQKEGAYQPNFGSSRYLKTNKKLNDLYSVILQSFNQINKKNLPGIVYAFAKSNNNTINSIETFDEFKKFINKNKQVIFGFWKALDKNNSIIIELDYEDNFNPIFIDINDFQSLMPENKKSQDLTQFMKQLGIPNLFTEDSKEIILNNIKKGQFGISKLPSNVIQAHLPYIEKKNVINTYPVFD